MAPLAEFWQQVVQDNANVGLSIGTGLARVCHAGVAPLVVPLFVDSCWSIDGPISSNGG